MSREEIVIINILKDLANSQKEQNRIFENVNQNLFSIAKMLRELLGIVPETNLETDPEVLSKITYTVKDHTDPEEG